MGIATAAAVAGAVGSVAGAAGNLIGGSKGAAGSQQSQYLQAMEMNQNIVNTQPFIQAGQTAANQLSSDVSGGTLGAMLPASDMANYPVFNWNPTQAGLEQTPGYQFTLQQGLQAAQNQAAARGLGVSGAALKASDTFATGLANTTYNAQLQNYLATYGQQVGQFQGQFNDYWANQQNRYNQLSNLATLGGNVAVGQGSVGTTGAANVGNAAANTGAIQGAATTGAASTLGNALSSPQTASALNALFGGGGSTINAPGSANYNPNQTYGGFTANPDDTFT